MKPLLFIQCIKMEEGWGWGGDKKERKENFLTHQLKKLHFKSIK